MAEIMRRPVAVSVHVLGSFTVSVEGATVQELARLPTSVLALLSMGHDNVVATSDLIEEIWPRDPSKNTKNTLQAYVMQIRRALDRALRTAGSTGGCTDILTTVGEGYRLNTVGGEVDFLQFREDLGNGRRALSRGAVETASAHFRDALDRWKGTPWAGVSTTPKLDASASRLHEEWLLCVESWVECEFRRGRYQEILPLLAECLVQYPHNETLCSRYMWALNRAGRRVEAKGAYDALRMALAREDLKPSAALSRLLRSIRDESASVGTASGPLTEELACGDWSLHSA
ncbi:AfsR/SARP family transcriptional regulator [Kocuria indica]|uniref:AfsR/SARP family transcriptional regulator n=1 Tax=Kocuria marina TaxID=223184 RepID=UPI001EF697FE|nr:AfsR/SARP family transcriptional regulator [Kocuria indica]MCG7431231.1 AfsR/SARP family transcriptional regulator [Kocuria indica]